MVNYKSKYLKYKFKYQKLIGGMEEVVIVNEPLQITDSIIITGKLQKFNYSNHNKIEIRSGNNPVEIINSNIKLLQTPGSPLNQMRKLFIRHIFKKYANYNIDYIDDEYIIIITGHDQGGYGDMLTLYKIFNILETNFQHVFLCLPGYDDKNITIIENTLQLKKKKSIGNINVFETLNGEEKIYTKKNTNDYEKIKNIITRKLPERTIIDVITPVCDFYDTYYSVRSNGVCIKEYGLPVSEINQYSSGLDLTELGIYINEENINNVEITDTINFIAYFHPVELSKIYLLYIYLVFRIIEFKDININIKINVYAPTTDIIEALYSLGLLLYNDDDGVLRVEPKTHTIDNYEINISNYEEQKNILNLICKNTKTNFEKIITINFNKLEHNTFKSLVKNCYDWCLVGCTGDQSISEVISFNKIPFYQILPHKEEFASSLILLSSNRGYENIKEYFQLQSYLEKKNFEDFSLYSRYYDLYKIIMVEQEFTKNNGFNDIIKKEFNIKNVIVGLVKYKILEKEEHPIIKLEKTSFKNMFKSGSQIIEIGDYMEWNDIFK